MLDAHPMGFLAISDIDRARAFYEGVLGLDYVSDDPFALVMRSGPLVIRLTPVGDQLAPRHYTVFGWQVGDIAAEVAALTAQGVRFERYDFFGDSQSPEGIWTSPAGAQVAWFKDPDGNLLSLSQHAD
jgi:catechol 2,3-dioxygenase-like lactoylglutathione lyase family enzyme